MDFKILSLIIIFVVITIFVSIIVYVIFDNNSSKDGIGNELTITIEIMVGIFIAILIHNFANKRQNKIDSTLEKIGTMIQRIESIENIQHERMKKEDSKIEKKRKAVYLEVEGKMFHLTVVDTLLENWADFDKFDIKEKNAKTKYIEDIINNAHNDLLKILKENLDLLDNKYHEQIIGISSEFNKLLNSAIAKFEDKKTWEELAKYLQLYSLLLPKQYVVWLNEDSMKKLFRYVLIDKKFTQ